MGLAPYGKDTYCDAVSKIVSPGTPVPARPQLLQTAGRNSGCRFFPMAPSASRATFPIA